MILSATLQIKFTTTTGGAAGGNVTGMLAACLAEGLSMKEATGMVVGGRRRRRELKRVKSSCSCICCCGAIMANQVGDPLHATGRGMNLGSVK